MLENVAQPRISEPQCALCGSTEARLRFQDEPYSVLDCLDCGLTYVSPQLAPEALINEVYGADYWSSENPRTHGYGDYRGDQDLIRKTFERRWSALQRFFPEPGRALDVGCATGSFLQLLRMQGWEVTGLEPSLPIALCAREQLGAEVVLNLTLEAAKLPEKSFDIVTLWDVLEHLPDPKAALIKVRRMLRPSGRLVIETQNIRSLFARALGRRWHHFKHREHLTHFHKDTLTRVLDEAGFQLIELRSRDAGKYVRGNFIVERSARLHRKLPAILQPLLGGDWSTYINLHDELIVVAELRR
ncbi:MAG: 2-polyprenyl-3-methyl-5-hydroxy-6-metoxy-1,4-benzoquinol methylase [Planctomycetota bacterium]|jgi:2-polyprenyl-3-methyl-5-hydroxy-6-metoxy-1,4-benzoquinol methylase